MHTRDERTPHAICACSCCSRSVSISLTCFCFFQLMLSVWHRGTRRTVHKQEFSFLTWRMWSFISKWALKCHIMSYTFTQIILFYRRAQRRTWIPTQTRGGEAADLLLSKYLSEGSTWIFTAGHKPHNQYNNSNNLHWWLLLSCVSIK